MAGSILIGAVFFRIAAAGVLDQGGNFFAKFRFPFFQPLITHRLLFGRVGCKLRSVQTEEEARSLRTYFDRLYDTLGFNERLSFIASEGDQVASVAEPRFHVCGQAERPEQFED